MSRFRAARIVETGGRRWEIYVYRTRPVRMKQIPAGSEPYAPYGIGSIVVWVAIELPVLVAGAIWRVVQWAASTLLAIARNRGSSDRFVEAIDFSSFPNERRLWWTTSDKVDRVVEQIAQEIGGGTTPRPPGATLL
jgi:hypothetical protein